MSKSASLKATLGIFKLPKPRNPFVVQALKRHAGSHVAQPGGSRQALRLMTLRELGGFELTPVEEDDPESSGR
jgi:hypothetical protein